METIRLTQKTYEYVFEHFRDQILSGNLKINDRIPTEREIAEELGVSRNSVREVMHMLEMTGMLECIQGSGNYVRCDPRAFMSQTMNMVAVLQQIRYSEVYDLRTAYEFTALRLAVDNADESEIAEIGRILERMDGPMSPRDSSKYDIEFHNALVHASHNRLLIYSYEMAGETLDNFIRDFRIFILADRQRSEQLRRAHWKVYEALLARDADAGQKALDRHFAVVREQVERIGRKSGQTDK